MQRRHFISLLAGLIPGATAARIDPRRADTSIPIQQSPIAGFQYHHGEALWEQLAVGQRLTLAREPDNRHDRRAVRVGWQGYKLGYLPRVENTAVAQMLDRGQLLQAKISGLERSRNPWKRITLAVHVIPAGQAQATNS